MSGRGVRIACLAALVGISLWAIQIESATRVRTDSGAYLTFGFLVGWSFGLGGLIAWRRRPGNRIGPLMVATGLAWLSSVLTDSPDDAVFTVGLVVSSVWPALLLHLLLAYPSGRLDRVGRIIVGIAYADTVGHTLLQLPFTQPRLEPNGASPHSASNLLLVSHHPDLVSALESIAATIGVGLILASLVVVWRRWRGAVPAMRRVLAPVYVTGAVAIGVILVVLVITAVFGLSSRTSFYAYALAFTAVPLGYLYGVLQTRLDRSAAVETLFTRLPEQYAPGGLRQALRDALNDQTLDVAYRRREADEYIDSDGAPYALPEPGADRAVSTIELGGQVVAALVHDPALASEPGTIEAVTAPAALAIANERLQADLRAQIQERNRAAAELAVLAEQLAASRARIVAAGDEERRRLERNLHDGAQQRLISLSLGLRMARSAVADDHPAAELIDASSTELSEALAELRELARGIHPAILTDQGLKAALESLVARSRSVPVELSVEIGESLPEPVEAALYYVAAEALTNVAKYASATGAWVSVRAADGRAVLQVRDDGAGGAEVTTGGGLAGLTDRVEALGGRLQISSLPGGGGTTVTADLPTA